MHQQLANYDPYTIEEVQFFIQKKTKYTTLKSVLISVAILALTIVLNLGLIEQLWIGRAQLDVTSTERKMSQQQFTQAFLCVIAKNTSTTLPNSTLYTFSRSLNRTTRVIPTTQIFTQNSYLLNFTQQRNFQCYNLQGAIINGDIYMQLNIYDLVDSFDFVFRVFTTDQITGKTIGQNSIYFQTVPNGRNMDYMYKIKKIHGLIYDSLLIDYQPETIYGFSPIYTQLSGITVQGYSSVRFLSQTEKPYDITTSYTLTRANIAEILGKLLSWFSIFVLIAAIAIKPILQYNYRVQLCKKLYDNQKLTRINISILSYIKYIISFVKRDIFDQSILYSAFEQLEIDLDLLNLVKKQQMMKKLIKQNQYVSKQIDQLNGTSMGLSLVENNQDDQKQAQDLFIGKFLNNQLLSQNSKDNSNNNNNQHHRKHLLQYNNNSGNIPLITCPDPQTQQSFITNIFKSLDCSETSISLISNKGQGYKTSWNTILTVICLAGVLWFIIFAGILKMQPNYKISSIAVDYDDSVIANVTINPQDMLFRSNVTDPFDDFYLHAVMLDQDDNVIKNVTLLTGSDCDSYKQNLNQSSTDWYCLSQTIHLSNNGKGNKTKLGLKVIFNGFGFIIPEVEILLWQYNILNNQLIKTKIYTNYQYSSNQVYKHDGQAVIYINENQQQSIPENVLTTKQLNPNIEFLTCNKPAFTTQAVFKGITYQIQPQMIKITKQLPTIWDVIDSAWGIVVLAFSVFLSRITRYLNIKERQKIIKGQQNQTRNDIISIVSTQYKLIYRVFAKQLEQVKYFYKTNLDHFGSAQGR